MSFTPTASFNYEPFTHMEFIIHEGSWHILCESCGNSKDLVTPGQTIASAVEKFYVHLETSHGLKRPKKCDESLIIGTVTYFCTVTAQDHRTHTTKTVNDIVVDWGRY